MKDDFEKGLSELDGFLKGGYTYLASNAGKVIALITVVIAALVTFTDVTLAGIGGRGFTTGLIVMLFSSYVIYFALESSGERLGENTENFKSAYKRYSAVKQMIKAEDMSSLRSFCHEYSICEAEYRRKSYLAEAGISEEDYAEYKNRKDLPKAIKRKLKKYEKIKPYALTPALLMSGERLSSKSELKNPELSRIISLFLGLLPTTLGTFFTVSVMLTAKPSLTVSTVLEGIFKLSALPIIGFKGYGAGYSYVKEQKSLWIDTKARILEEFIAKKGS